MINLRRLMRDHADAGSVNSLLAVWGFVDDDTFLTKAGHVGLVYRLHGVDYECLDHVQRRDVVHRFEAALRLLDEHCRVYEYLTKRRVAPFVPASALHPVAADAEARRAAYLNDRRTELFAYDLHLVLVYEGLRPSVAADLRSIAARPADAVRRWLSTSTVCDLLEHELDRAIAQLHHRASAFEVQLADTMCPERLPKSAAFQFFRRLVNYGQIAHPPLQYDTHVDFFMSDSTVECQRRHLDINDTVVKVLTMKEPPTSTFAHVLEALHGVPGEFIACLEWCRIPNTRVRRDIQARRRHFFNKRVSLINYVAPDTRPEEMLVNESATATVKQLGDALTDIEVHGHFFGECSLTLVFSDADHRVVDRAAAEAAKVIATQDGTVTEETYNLLNAWLAIVPGNSAYNLRRLVLLETNCADLSFLFALNTGEPTSAHLRREALAIFETRHQAPYHFALHVDDVGHTLVLGATGSGKSFLLNFLVTHAQKYDPFTAVFDLGQSYRKLSSLFGGSYVEIGLRQQGVTINPFALPPTPEHLHFLHAFMRLLIESGDGYRLSELEDRELYEALENLYVLDTPQRRLFTVANLLPRAMAARLSKWVDGGRYAQLFDHVEDTLTVRRFQVFEFDGMREYPAVLEPLLFYVLHRVSSSLSAAGAGFKLCVMDEAWRFIQHERLRAYVEEALKTWRKRNAAMVLATHTINDFASTDLLRTVVESCPTKLLLANPALDPGQYREFFQLNNTELELVTTLMPRQQVLLKRQHLTKVLNLNVDSRSYWLYTNTPVDNHRVATTVADLGLDAALDHLAAMG